MDRLPAHCVFTTSSFLEDLGDLMNLRHTCSHFFQLSSNDHWKVQNGARATILKSKDHYIHFFKFLLSYETKEGKKNDIRWLGLVLNGVLNGAIRLMELYGFKEGKFVIELFFETLFNLLLPSNGATSYELSQLSPLLQLLLSCLKERSSLWRSFDNCSNNLFPRCSFVEFCVQASQQGVLSQVLKLLYENGLNYFNEIYFSREFGHYDFKRHSPHLIPHISTNFSLLHLVTWMHDLDSVRKLLNVQRLHIHSTDEKKKRGMMDINIVDALGRTVLHYAIANNSLQQVAKVLLEMNENTEPQLNPFLQDLAGVSAVTMAHLHERGDILEILKNKYGNDKVNNHFDEYLKQNQHLFNGLRKINPERKEPEEDEAMDCQSDDGEDDSALYELDEHKYGDENYDYDFLECDYDYGSFQSLRRLEYGYDSTENIQDLAEHWAEENPCLDPDIDSDDDNMEEGLNTELIVRETDSAKMQQLIELFETVDESEEMDDEWEPIYKRIKVQSRTPVWDLECEAKRIEESGDKEEPDPKRRKLLSKDSIEELKRTIVKREDLEVPKKLFNPLVREISAECGSFRSDMQFTLPSFFLLQDAAERLVREQLHLAHLHALFYNRKARIREEGPEVITGTVHSIDYRLACINLPVKLTFPNSQQEELNIDDDDEDDKTYSPEADNDDDHYDDDDVPMARVRPINDYDSDEFCYVDSDASSTSSLSVGYEDSLSDPPTYEMIKESLKLRLSSLQESL